MGLDNLGTVDSATGATTIIGNMGTFLTDIAFDPSGNLYGVGGLGFQHVFSVNKVTGLATDLGDSGTPLNSLVFGPDGTMYSAYGTTLYTVNPITAAVTTVGTTGFTASGDLAFHAGNLYMTAMDSGTDDLVQINPVTGAGTLIGPIGATSVYGLADGHDGVLYGVVGNHVISINTTTGAGTPVSSWPIFNGSFGNAAGADIAPVPEPGSLMMLGERGDGDAGAAEARGRGNARSTRP